VTTLQHNIVMDGKKDVALVSVSRPVVVVIEPRHVRGVDIPFDKDYSVDCSDFGMSPGCKSFNELVSKQDEDIISQVQTQAFVCFVPNEDTFMMLSYQGPEPSLFTEKTKFTETEDGVVFYSRFKSGIQDEFKILPGTWTRTKSNVAWVSFESSKEVPAHASISSPELSFAYDYKNLRGTTTTYALQIRRSTKRFVQTFQFPNDDSPAKNTKSPQPQNSASKMRTEDTGHCAEFK
jgi:hypothetical protein